MVRLLILIIEYLFLLAASNPPPFVISPAILSPSSIVYLINSAVLTTSLNADLYSLHTSSATTFAISSFLSSIKSAALYKYFALSTGANSFHAFKAALADFIASSTSSLDIAGTVPNNLLSIGE